MDLRPYQEQAVEQIVDWALARPKGGGRLLVVLAPRAGKTAIAATAARLMALDQGLRVLWVVQRVEILDATVDHLARCNVPRDKIGVLYRDRKVAPEAPFQVASEATLDRRSKPEADIVIWDEAHHDAAPRRRRIRALYPDAFHLGITGTPERLSGMGLDADYDDLIVPVQPSELIHDDYLAVPTVYAPEDKHLPSVKGLRIRGGDYDTGMLEKLVGHAAAIDKLVEEWARLAEKRGTVVFPVTVAHSKHIAERFIAAGIPAEHLDGDVTPAARADMIARLRSGSLPVVCSVGVLSEGTDLPEVKCVVLARPTRSLALHIQQGARCMTPWRGMRPRILDVVGNSYRHGFPWDDRPWSLTKKRRAGYHQNEQGPLVKRCPSCSALTPRVTSTCSGCGHAFAVEVGPVEVKTLAEVRFTTDQIAQKRAQLEAFAAERKFKTEWVDRVLAAMFAQVA